MNAPTATDADIRDRILDAAEACIARYGVPKTTIDDVIKRADVARATLYKYFPGGRDELVLEVLLRESRRNIDVVLDAVDRAGTLEDSLADGILAACDRIREDEHLAFLFSPEMIGHTSRVPGAGAAIVAATAEIIGPLLDQGRAAGVVADDLDELDASEWAIRMILSLLTFDGPSGRTRAELREFVRRFAVAPLLRPGNR